MKRVALLVLPLLAVSAPAMAQLYPHGRAYDDPYGQRLRGPGERRGAEPAKALDITVFRAVGAADRLGHGPIVIAAAPADMGDAKLPVYEAAVVDRLAASGYDTAVSDSAAGQIAEVSVTKAVVVPDEPPRKPVSGSMGVSVGNRGTSTALAIAVDLTKPKQAIHSTRLDVRIRDRATGQVLWEGHAEGQAREDKDGDFDDGAMAARLAAGLFARFPEAVEVAAGQ